MKTIAGAEPKLTTCPRNPLQKAIEAANQPHWTVRAPEDVQRLVARAIKDAGGDRTYWIIQCLRAGLAKYAKKRDQQQGA